MAIDGKWKITVNTPMGVQDVTLDLKTEGAALMGTLSNASGTVPIEDGKVDGNTVSLKAKVSVPLPLTLDCSGTIDGDAISGTVRTSFGSWPFSGNRV